MTRSAGWRKAKNGQDDVVSGQPVVLAEAPVLLADISSGLLQIRKRQHLAGSSGRINYNRK